MSTRERRTTLDVANLPELVFGPRDLMWWGTVGFMIIEGFTLVLMTASYFYLRLNFSEWPPGRTPLPSLGVPTASTGVLLLAAVAMYLAARAAERFERGRVTLWLAAATLLMAAATVLRWFDLLALHVRWDAHAYGSAAWGVVGLHATLVVVDLFESAVLLAMFASGRAEKKHYSDTCDAAMYQYFLSLSWVAVYLIVYWGPRVL